MAPVGGVLLALVAAGVFLASPGAAGGPPEFQSGDLVVGTGQVQVLTNRTLIIDGNVSIEPAGTLVLLNSTIEFNLTANGSLWLTVKGGGTLRVLDLDGAPQTPLDASRIGSTTASLRYLAVFEAGSNVLVQNSAITAFGYSLLVPGLLIRADNVTFKDAELRAYSFLKVDGASPSFEGTLMEGQGAGSNYFYNSAARLSNCTLGRHFVAVSASQGSSLSLAGAVIRDSAFWLAANGSTVSVEGASVNNSSAGLFLTNASQVTLTDVDFGPSPVSFDDSSSGLVVRRQFTALVLNAVSEPVRGANVTVTNATAAMVASGVTGAAGSYGPFTLVLYRATSAARFDEGNYTVGASNLANATARSISAATESALITLALTSNIDPRATLVSPSPGAVLLAGVAQRFEVLVSDPDGPDSEISVTWRSSIQGPLGAGSRLDAPLIPGQHTVEAEVRDAAGGWRLISVEVTADPGTEQTFTDGSQPARARVEIWKVAPGSVELLPVSFGSTSPPAEAVGSAFDIHPSNGSLEWAWARVTLWYQADQLWYGIDEASLRILKLDSVGNWTPFAGQTIDLANRSVTVNVSRPATGLGTFLLVGTKGPNLPPVLAPIPRLVAVRNVSFSFTLVARDSPGDAITFELYAAPSWLSVDPSTGIVAGVPPASARGLVTITAVAIDSLGANASAPLEIFVTGPSVNQPPRLLNPLLLPSDPVDRTEVTFQVTYFDEDDDAPVILEVAIDGNIHPLEPVNVADLNFTDGKTYSYRTVLAAGNHTVVFRVNDGYPDRVDLEPIKTYLVVGADSLRQLNNAFLALFASLAATLLLVLWLTLRSPKKTAPKAEKPPEEESSIALLSGEDLRPIPPSPPRKPRAPDKADALEVEADILAGVARQEAKLAKSKLDPKRDKDD